MTSLATKFMEKKAKKYATGKAGDFFNPKQQYINDPEIRAAQEEAAKSIKRHWWKRQTQPDIILNDRDRQILHSVKRRATYLDKGCECCCFTFGFDFVIGLIPGVGDAIGMILGLELIKVASKADLPRNLQIQMVTNVVLDFLVGLVPIIGDIMDAVVKSNWRNAMILEDFLMLRRRDELRAERGLPKITDSHGYDDGDSDNQGGSLQIHSPDLQATSTSTDHQIQSAQPTSSGSTSASPEQKKEKHRVLW